MILYLDVFKYSIGICRSERALQSPELLGTIKLFCREKGHGFIIPNSGGEDIFVHVSE